MRPRHVPTRTCVACRTARLKRELVRIVRAPDGGLAFDETGRRAGRGAYLCRNAACWRDASRKGLVRRALDVELTEELRAMLEAGPAPVASPQTPIADQQTPTPTR